MSTYSSSNSTAKDIFNKSMLIIWFEIISKAVKIQIYPKKNYDVYTNA